MSVLDEIQEAMRANGGGGGGLGVVFVAVVFAAAIVVAIIEIALRFLPVVFPRPPFYSGQVEFRVIFPICIQERFILVLWSPLPTLAWVGLRSAGPSPSRTREDCRYGSSYRTSSGSRLSLVLSDLFKKKVFTTQGIDRRRLHPTPDHVRAGRGRRKEKRFRTSLLAGWRNRDVIKQLCIPVFVIKIFPYMDT